MGQGARDSFPVGQMNQGVHDANHLWDVRWRHEPGEDEVLFQTERMHFRLESFLPRPSADDQELDTGTTLNQRGGGGDEVVVALELEKAGDFSDHEIFRLESEPFAEREIVAGIEERLQGKATEYARELIRLADAGG